MTENFISIITSPNPDKDFVYGGTIISNGDVGYQGLAQEKRNNMTANDHGSLENINGRWYIFHHRQTHRSTFSRQACAEKVTILSDGSIPQVECTSMGLNPGPLQAEGCYAAPYCCVLTNGAMPYATNTTVNAAIPHITHCGGERFITGIKDGTKIGYKYFRFSGPVRVGIRVRGEGGGVYLLSTDEAGTEEIGRIAVWPSPEWAWFETEIDVTGEKAPYLRYNGTGFSELLEIRFS